eukprot:302196_1
MSISFLKSVQQQQCLIAGYNKAQSKKQIPNVINELCLKFYDTNMRMNIEQNTLMKFKSNKNHEQIYSNEYNNMGFIVVCCISPAVWKPLQKRQVIFNAECKQIPNDVTNVTFICKMFCPQTETSYQTTKTFNLTPNTVLFWKWPDNSLWWKDCEYKHKLDFICNIEILHIEFYGRSNEDYHTYGLTLRSDSDIMWNIDNKTLQKWKQFTQYGPNIHIGPYFYEGRKIHLGPDLDNGNWKLFFVQPIWYISGTIPQSVQNKYVRSDQFKYQIYIELCKWPQYVTQIKIRCKLKVFCSYKKLFNVKKNKISHTQQLLFTTSDNRKIVLKFFWPITNIHLMTSLKFHCKIKIKDVYCKGVWAAKPNEIVRKIHWSTYGIND